MFHLPPNRVWAYALTSGMNMNMYECGDHGKSQKLYVVYAAVFDVRKKKLKFLYFLFVYIIQLSFTKAIRMSVCVHEYNEFDRKWERVSNGGFLQHFFSMQQ